MDNPPGVRADQTTRQCDTIQTERPVLSTDRAAVVQRDRADRAAATDRVIHIVNQRAAVTLDAVVCTQEHHLPGARQRRTRDIEISGRRIVDERNHTVVGDCPDQESVRAARSRDQTVVRDVRQRAAHESKFSRALEGRSCRRRVGIEPDDTSTIVRNCVIHQTRRVESKCGTCIGSKNTGSTDQCNAVQAQCTVLSADRPKVVDRHRVDRAGAADGVATSVHKRGVARTAAVNLIRAPQENHLPRTRQRGISHEILVGVGVVYKRKHAVVRDRPRERRVRRARRRDQTVIRDVRQRTAREAELPSA